MSENQKHRTLPHMNSYLAGFLLGLTLLASFYFTGKGLGASGAVKSTITAAISTVSPEHVQKNHYLSKFAGDKGSPMKSWLVFEILGVLVGGLISGAIAGRLKLQIEHAPNLKPKKRLLIAGLGGISVGIGASLGRGCASGAALSGMSVLSTAGFIAFLSIFGFAFVMAYFVRRLWI